MKKILLLSIVVLLVSCSDKPKFIEKQIEKTSENCDEDCLNIHFSYLFCEKPSKFSENFNKEIEAQLVNFLSSNPIDSLKITNLSVSKALDNFMMGYKNIHEHFPDIAPYELMLNDTISFQNEKILSLVSKRYSYTGGAHGISATILLNFDISSGKVISNDSLFSNVDEILKIAEFYFKEEQKKLTTSDENENNFWFEGDKFQLPQNIGFSSEFLILFYNPYEIAPYANGSFEIKIPIEKVKPYLKI